MVLIVAVDIEATGMNPHVHSIIEIGAVCLDTETLEVESTFQVAIKHEPDARWEPRCLQEFWTNPKNCPTAVVSNLLQRVRNNGLPPRQAMQAFYDWLQALHTKDHPVKQIVSDNVAFDVAWLDYELLRLGITDMPLAYAFCGFDVNGNPAQKEYRQARSLTDLKKGFVRRVKFIKDQDMYELAGVGPEDTAGGRGIVHDHCAVNDAHKIAHDYALLYRQCKDA